jgi:hypothetical protein
VSAVYFLENRLDERISRARGEAWISLPFYVYIFLAPLYLGLTLKNSSVYYLPFPENPSRQIKLGEVY